MLQFNIRTLSASVIHLLEHTLVVVLGLALAVLGLAMAFSIVFVLPGIVILALGFSIVVGGLFDHALTARSERGA